MYFDALTSDPPRINQFLERVNKSVMNILFTYKPTNPEPTLQPPPLMSSHSQGHYPHALTTPKTRYLATRDGPYATETTDIAQTSQS